MHHTARKLQSQLTLIKIGFLLIGGVSLLLGGWFFLFAGQHLPPGRYIFAVLGDPVEVAMYDAYRQRWATVQFPADTTMSGVQGLGEYRLDALWDVAATESSPSSILMQTLTYEMGIPVTHYLGQRGALWRKRSSDQTMFKQLITLSHILQFLSHSYDTNISLGEFIGLIRQSWGVKDSQIATYQLTEGKGLMTKKAADQTSYIRFDQQTFDRYTDDEFQDISIRQEGYRIAIYNTTDLPFIGSRVARILSKLGVNVVFVGNDPTPIQTCELIGNPSIFTSHTVKVMTDIFACTKKLTTESMQADLVLKIGTSYAKKYFTLLPLLHPLMTYRVSLQNHQFVPGQ